MFLGYIFLRLLRFRQSRAKHCFTFWHRKFEKYRTYFLVFDTTFISTVFTSNFFVVNIQNYFCVMLLSYVMFLSPFCTPFCFFYDFQLNILRLLYCLFVSFSICQLLRSSGKVPFFL